MVRECPSCCRYKGGIPVSVTTVVALLLLLVLVCAAPKPSPPLPPAAAAPVREVWRWRLGACSPWKYAHSHRSSAVASAGGCFAGCSLPFLPPGGCDEPAPPGFSPRARLGSGPPTPSPRPRPLPPLPFARQPPHTPTTPSLPPKAVASQPAP